MAITYDALMKKNPTPDERGKLDEFIDALELINVDEKSYLKEELQPYIDAIRFTKNHSGSRKDLENHLKVLEGFQNFLVSGEFQSNYSRILQDAKLAGVENPSIVIDEGLHALNDYLELGLDFDALNKSTNKLTPGKQRRPGFSGNAKTFEDFMKIASYGKTFREPGCIAANDADKMLANFTKVIEQLQKPVEKEDPETTKEKADLAKHLTELKNAVEVMKAENPSKEDVEKAIQTVNEFPKYLVGGIHKSNYTRLTEAGMNPVQFESGFRAVNKGLNQTVDFNSIKKATGYIVKEDTADNWIKGWKNELKRNPDSFKPGAEETKRFIAKIMATRMLVNSVRKDGSAFSKRVTNLAIDQKADELLQNKAFNKFVTGIVTSKKSLAEAGKAISAGHCGGLDDAFKQFILESPSGKLPNEPLLKRYMPKVIDRIELLQSRAKFLVYPMAGASTMPKEEIAEVYALRSMIRTPGGSKEKLKVDIPTDKNLEQMCKANMKDNLFNKTLKAEDLDLFFKGHGGKFADEKLIPEGLISKGGPLWLSATTGREDALEGLHKNINTKTYVGRMELLQLKGMLVVTDLKEAIQKDPDSQETKDLAEKAKAIILEGCALVEDYREKKAAPDAPKALGNYDKQRVDFVAFRLNQPTIKEELFGKDPQTVVKEMHKFVKAEYGDSYIQKLMNAHEKQVSWNPDKFYEHLNEHLKEGMRALLPIQPEDAPKGPEPPKGQEPPKGPVANGPKH